ncbi:MAG: GyrI-like domain-containing protein [Bacteroidota bacterium]
MGKLDLKKTLNTLYQPSAKEVTLVTVPEFAYFMIDGTGDPNDSGQFQAAVEALYSLSYTLKFDVKKGGGQDYAVMPLEGLWRCTDMACFDVAERSNWLWTLLMVQPMPPTEAEFVDLSARVQKKKNLPAVGQVRLELWTEGLSAQTIHVGPFSEEGPTVARVHAFIEENGYQPQGKHHEIYLSDPRRTAPEKMKTVLRQPVTAV